MAETQPGAAGRSPRQREYETLFLVKPDVPDEAVDRIKEKLRGVVSREGGKVLKFTHWGKKKTAFLVERQPRAVFMHMSYLGKPGLVSEIERNLAILEEVSKYMSQRIADDIDPETRQVEADVKLTGDADERPRTEPREPEAEKGEKPERRETPVDDA